MRQTQRVGKTATTTNCPNPGFIEVVYHQTRVVDVTPNTITLDTGGWFTATTKARMNQASNQFGLGYQVDQRKGQWFVEYQGETIPFDKEEITLNRKGAQPC